MGFPLDLALRYMSSRKRAFISVGTMFATLGVALGVGALATVMSVTGGFRAQFREKVLGVNAHVLVLKYASDFREYRRVMDDMKKVPGVIGVAPFVINPMMITHADRTATGVLLKGVDPAKVEQVLDLPRHIIEGSLDGLRLTDSKPAERRRRGLLDEALDSKLGVVPLVPGVSGDPLAPLPSSSASGAAPVGATSAAPVDEARGSALRAIEEIVKAEALSPSAPGSRTTADPDESAAGAPFAARVAEEDQESDRELVLPEGAPIGNIVPEGGYAGELPEDDILPAEVDLTRAGILRRSRNCRASSLA